MSAYREFYDNDDDFDNYGTINYTSQQLKLQRELQVLEDKYGGAMSASHPSAFLNYFKGKPSDQTKIYNTIDKLVEAGQYIMVDSINYGGYGERTKSSRVYSPEHRSVIVSNLSAEIDLADTINPVLYKQYLRNKGSKNMKDFKKDGICLKYLTKFLYKITSILQHYNLSFDDYMNMDIEDDPLGIYDQYETELIKELKQNIALMQTYDNVGFYIGISMKVGVPSKAKNIIIKGPMKESTVKTICVIECFKKKLIPKGYSEQDFDLPIIDPEWYDRGMEYDEIELYMNEFAKTHKQSLRINIHDRLSTKKPMKSFNKKISGSNYIDLKFYRTDFHLDTQTPYKILDKYLKSHQEKIDDSGTWKTAPTYLSAVNLRDEFLSQYKELKGIRGNFSNGACDIYMFWTKDSVYLLDEHSSGIDRKKYPYKLTKSGVWFSKFMENHSMIPDNHRLIKYFSPEKPIELLKTNDSESARVYKETSMARGFLIGRVNEDPLFPQMKIDRNRAFSSYWQCKYTKNKDGTNWIPGIPWGSIYSCDNSILDCEGICGSIFATIHKPPFMLNKNRTVIENLGFLDSLEGQFDWVEMQFYRDIGVEYTIHAIIPAFKEKDTFKPFIDSVNSAEDDPKIAKREINKIIGKFLTSASTKTDITTNPTEAARLMDIYRSEGRAPELHSFTTFSSDFDTDEADAKTIPTTHIITSLDNTEYSKSRYTHLHNHIIAAYRVDMMQMIMDILDQGCQITQFRIDSITFHNINNHIGVKNYLTKKYVSAGTWKWEEYKPENSLINYARPKPKIDFWDDIKNVAKFDPLLCHRTLLISGRAGFGKTTLIRSLFPDNGTVIYCAFTHSAAHLLSPNAITLDALIKRLKENRIPLNFWRIIIDEISQATMSKIMELNRLLKFRFKSDEMWGGIGMIFVGDSAQVLPVAEKNCKNQHNIFKSSIKYYEHKLTKNYRSTSNYFNKVYAELADIVDTEEPSLWRKFKERLFDPNNPLNKKCVVNKLPKDIFDKDYTAICYTNSNVSRGNNAYYKLYKGPKKIIIDCTISGVCYKNQDGIVDNDGNIILDSKKVAKYSHSYFRELQDKEKTKVTVYVAKIIGSDKTLEYFMGHAITVHKAQGKTYDNDIIVIFEKMDARTFYTAITRTSDPDNKLKIYITQEDIKGL